jgi:hypothetical protein
MKIPSKVNVDTGGGGSGAGAEVTALAESLQAYACATRQFLGKDLVDVSQITEKTIGDADCDRTLKACMKGLDEIWFSSVIRTANQIFIDVPGASGGKSFKFYRGGKFVNDIYDEWRRMKEGSGITGDDKWNPADIWMAKKGFKFKDGWKSLRDYNRYIYDNFANTELIGISLKKLGKEGAAHSKIFNNGKPLTANFTGVKLGMNMFDSKDIYIQFRSEGKDGEIQLRNFSSRPEPSSWQGEIKGKTAAGGKIGGGNVNEYLKKRRTDNAGLFTNSESEVFTFTKTPGFMKEFFRLYSLYYKGTDKLYTLKEFEAAAKAKDADSPGSFYFSKYMNLKFIDLFETSGKKNELASDFMYYAKSNTDESSYFLKVS